jgi:hypothetical protein
MPRVILAAVLAIAAWQSDPLRDALNIGRTQDEALYDAFTAGYQLPVSDSITRAEIITEFRRAVMIVREHANQGEYGLTARDLASAVAPYQGLVTVIVEVRMHPLTTLTKPPAYSMYIETGPRTPPVAPQKFAREPIYPTPVPAPLTALTGVRLQGTFSVADVAAAPSPRLMVLDDTGSAMWSARLDLSRFR